MIKKLIVSLALIIGTISGAAVMITNSYAADCTTNPSAAGCPCAINPSASICADLKKENGTETFNSTITNVINILLFAIGIVAVIIIIAAGIRMVTSRGDSSAVAKAMRTITYAVAGLVVAMVSFVIVYFVADNI